VYRVKRSFETRMRNRDNALKKVLALAEQKLFSIVEVEVIAYNGLVYEK